MSHPSFARVSPDVAADGPRRRARNGSSRPPWQASLGVSSTVSGVNLASFLLHSTSSILFLVFLNSTQPFIISQLGETKRQGSLSGTLVFSDELLSMFLVLFWGSLADITGTKVVAVIGYTSIAISLLAYTFAVKPWPDLLFCRLTFAIGGSAVTAMLSGILNSYTATEDEIKAQQSSHTEDQATEDTPLLGEGRDETSRPTRATKSKHGRLAALTGLMTGVGALIAVFFLLRLPTLLASIHDRNAPSDLPEDGGDEAIRRGTREAFYIVSALSLLVAVALAFGLKTDKPSDNYQSRAGQNAGIDLVEEERQTALMPNVNARQARRERLKKRLKTQQKHDNRILDDTRSLFTGILAGFGLARNDLSLTLGYLSGGLARACTIATTVFIPLLVTRFFYTSGLCSDLPSPDVPPAELKRICRQAFTVASILSGVIQLISLLLAPLIGYMCEATSPAITLLIATTIGTASFLTIGLALPHDGDPRTAIAGIAAIGIGICQIANIVASLAICASAKNRAFTHHITTASNDASSSNTFITRRTTTGGSIAGAYSATGGLFILLISKLGGTLSDLYAPAAFILMAFMAAITAIVSLLVVIRERRGNL